MSRTSRTIKILTLLLADTALTSLIAQFSVAAISSVLLNIWFGGLDTHWETFDGPNMDTKVDLRNLLHFDWGPTFSFKDSYFAVFFWSAFFTSIWVWLYVLSIFAIKLAHKVRPLWLKLLPYLDIEKKPMQAVGRIAGIMAGAGYALILGIVWLVHGGH